MTPVLLNTNLTEGEIIALLVAAATYLLLPLIGFVFLLMHMAAPKNWKRMVLLALNIPPLLVYAYGIFKVRHDIMADGDIGQDTPFIHLPAIFAVLGVAVAVFYKPVTTPNQTNNTATELTNNEQ